jgi:hypothetical protein
MSAAAKRMAVDVGAVDPYDAASHWIPGAPEHRPDHVTAALPRSAAVREEERALETFALFAVQLDARMRLAPEEVQREVSGQLRIPFHDLRVSRLSEATFLIKFDDQLHRNTARNKVLRIGHSAFRLLPWSRRVGAANELAKYRYRVRLRIEGIPSHVRQPESLASLFKNPVFIDEFNCAKEKPEEEICVCMWAWTSDPDGFAKSGTLEVEEPITLPQESLQDYLPDYELPPAGLRYGAAELLKYNVIIHLDRVLDYSTPPNSPSLRSMDSAQSGLPSDELEDAWPASHPFLWRLGVPDGGAAGRRVPVHERLGRRNRPESPPRGGGAGGFGGGLRDGYQQMPPSGPHDLGFLRHGMQQGGSSRGGAPSSGHRRRNGTTVATVWRPKTNAHLHQDKNSATSFKECCETGDSFLFRESQPWVMVRVDPMMDEIAPRAVTVCGRPMQLQCSVEPTAADGVDRVREVMVNVVGIEQHQPESIRMQQHEG